MALSFSRVAEVATHVKTVSDEAKALYARLVELLETNSDLSIDWAAGTLPDYIVEDGDGNIDGFKFSRAEVANVIGSLDNLRKAFANEAVSQGDHLGNLNKVAESDA
jgi:hypothetical protein